MDFIRFLFVLAIIIPVAVLMIYLINNLNSLLGRIIRYSPDKEEKAPEHVRYSQERDRKRVNGYPGSSRNVYRKTASGNRQYSAKTARMPESGRHAGTGNTGIKKTGKKKRSSRKKKTEGRSGYSHYE